MNLFKFRPLDRKPSWGSKIDPNHPLSQGLIGCWLMNEEGGNTLFDLADKNKTVNQGLCGFKGCNNGFGVNFPANSQSDCYSMGQPSKLINNLKQLTLEVLALPVTNTKNQMALIGHPYTDLGGATPPYDRYCLAMGSVVVPNCPKPFFRVSVGSIKADCYQNMQITANKWYHLIGTYNGAKLNLYSNGNLVAGPVNLSGTVTSANTNVYIGKQANWTGQDNVFQGIMMFAKIYNRALSAQEINNLYADPYCYIWKPKKYWLQSIPVVAGKVPWPFLINQPQGVF
jgi:hypothetical protein